jgi:hypothetical protein
VEPELLRVVVEHVDQAGPLAGTLRRPRRAQAARAPDPHQWRHTLGTVLINRDVPQHVGQKILDHDSAEMTAHYAWLSDNTVREHWERARKVNAQGQPVQISPDRPLGDAAWSKQRLSLATQALPNGHCELPMVRTCPHANSGPDLPDVRDHGTVPPRAVQALRELDRAGTPVTFAGVAQPAGDLAVVALHPARYQQPDPQGDRVAQPLGVTSPPTRPDRTKTVRLLSFPIHHTRGREPGLRSGAPDLSCPGS